MSTFHKWGSTDGENEDSCERCGVVTPDFGVGVIGDHGPMTICCPDDMPFNAHHFLGDPQWLCCAYCLATITGDTLPANVDWECRSPERPPIPEDHPNFVLTPDPGERVESP